MKDDVNKRLCELLGICWHEQVDDQTLQCKHCGAPMLFPWHQNPDFTSEKGRIDLLKRIRGMKGLDNFFLFYGEMQREEFGELPMVGLEFTSIFIDSIMLDDNGALARVALEFLEAKEASHDRNC